MVIVARIESFGGDLHFGELGRRTIVCIIDTDDDQLMEFVGAVVLEVERGPAGSVAGTDGTELIRKIVVGVSVGVRVGTGQHTRWG
jgi:hypothetical protein